ncbi:MAG: universal stress protein [Bacteroidia bacterium]|nr:universal stress protein [Bacteroidota bacterium]MBP6413918.1 universal stress protein [Bacteroidia bacterium]
MKNFKLNTILVPTDFSETAQNALNHAIPLSKKSFAKIVLLHVVESSVFVSPIDLISSGYIISQMNDDSKANLKFMSDKLVKEHNIEIEIASFSGNVFDNIIQAVYIYDADLIVMGSNSATGLKEWLFGSTAFNVVDTALVPVLTFSLNSNTCNFKKIVFPFNDNLLTLKKIEQVTVLSKIFNATILLFGFTDSHLISNMSIIRKKGYNLQKIFAEEGISSSLTLSHGDDYADEILKFANTESADIITVVASKNHGADKDFKLKPDKKLVNHSGIPVLCVPVQD